MYLFISCLVWKLSTAIFSTRIRRIWLGNAIFVQKSDYRAILSLVVFINFQPLNKQSQCSLYIVFGSALGCFTIWILYRCQRFRMYSTYVIFFQVMFYIFFHYLNLNTFMLYWKVFFVMSRIYFLYRLIVILK